MARRAEFTCPPEMKEHFDTAREEMRRGLETFLPPEFFTHRDSARREMLLAWRAGIDHALKRMDDKKTASA